MTSITKKQYLLSGRRVDGLSMTEHRIGDYYLYTDEQLNTCACRTADGKDVLLLGDAYCMDAVGKRAVEDVQSSPQAKLKEATRFWTGKWVLITQNTLFTDACGLMPAFYINKDGSFLVSSSLALLSRELGMPSDRCVKAQGLTWQMLPDTLLPGVSGLMCTQHLKLHGECVTPEFCSWVEDQTALSTHEKCERLAELLVNGIKNVHAFSGRKLLLALTGGKDSRVTLCALVRSGVPFDTYTAEHENISSSDKTVPAKLSKLAGVEHRYIKRAKLNTQLLQDYMHFTAGNSNGADAQFYACGQFDQIPSDAVVIRSGLYEAGQRYSRGLCDNTLEGLYRGISQYYTELQKPGPQKHAFDQWIDYVKNHSIGGIDLRDRLYIEQRVGGWAAAIEQSLDMNDFASIQIANCAALLSVLLSANGQERERLALSYDTIRLLDDRMLRYDVNKVALRDKLLRVKQIAKHPLATAGKFLNRSHGR